MKLLADLKFDGFSRWVTGRQFPDNSNYWDGNWQNVRASRTALNAKVSCVGPILMTADIASFRNDLAKLNSQLSGSAKLSGLELELEIRLQMANLGQINCEIDITPNQRKRKHQFRIELDHSHLPNLMKGCDAILNKFPVVGFPYPLSFQLGLAINTGPPSSTVF